MIHNEWNTPLTFYLAEIYIEINLVEIQFTYIAPSYISSHLKEL